METEVKESPETEIEVLPPRVLDSERVEFDLQIITAKAYPRSIKAFREQALSMATLDEETAASCFYVMPRGGKKIEGPSVRLAEIVALSWGNLRYGARVVGESEDGRQIIAEGFAHDLQSNNRVAIRVQRRITDKHARRYNDDMVAMTGNAACSVALRNAIFKVVPMTYVNAIYLKAKALAVGDATSLVDRRNKMVEHFSKFGVSQDKLLARIGKPSLDDVDLSDMETLLGLATAIREGELSIDEAFPTASATASNDLLSKLTKSKVPNKEEEGA